jgi:hypothetical protein
MDALLSKFQGKIDTKKIIATVNEIDALYIADGFTKEDIPPIVAKLMMMASGLKGLTGPERKKLVIGLLNHLIEKIERGEDDTEFETLLKSMVPAMVDGFAGMLKMKNCLPCFK